MKIFAATSELPSNRRRRYRSYGMARASLIISGASIAFWLGLLLPAALVAGSNDMSGSAVDLIRVFEYAFIAANLAGLSFASLAFVRSKSRKEMAFYGMFLNFMGIALNLVLFTL